VTFQSVSIARAASSTAQLQAEKARLNARDQIFSDWQRFSASLIKIRAAQAQVEAAVRAAQVARDRYAAGVTTQLELITADRDLFSAEVSQIQARTELAIARASLRISSGRPVK
jgi:outer membrane protein